jgi:hypothetical protein
MQEILVLFGAFALLEFFAEVPVGGVEDFHFLDV